MTIRGWPDQEKSSEGRGEHVTLAPIRTQQHGLDVRSHGTAYQVATGTVQAGSTARIILTNFSVDARKGDILIFTDGDNAGHEATIYSVDGQDLTLVENIPAVPTAGDAIRLLRLKTLEVTASGGLPSSLSFVLDGLNQVVTEDTGTPANNRPLPVKLTGFDGDVSINSANLNLEVQLSHLGADADSTRIGDGTETLAISPDGGAQIAGSNNSVLRQGTGASVTGSLNVHVGGIEGVSTNYGANTTALRTAAMIGNPTGVADFNAGNASAQTLRTVIATDQAPIPVSQDGQWDIGDITGTIALPTGAATEAKQDSIISELQNVVQFLQDDIDVKVVDKVNLDFSVTNVTTSAYVEIIASTADDIRRLSVFESSGRGMILATGAAASEVDLLYIPPGGLSGEMRVSIASGTRLSIKAIEGLANVGRFLANFTGPV